MRDFAGATKCLEKVVQLAPKAFEPHVTLVGIAEEMGQKEKVLYHQEMAAKLAKSKFELWRRAAELAEEQGDAEKALQYLKKDFVISKEPASLVARGRLLMELGDMRRAGNAFGFAATLFETLGDKMDFVKETVRILTANKDWSRLVYMLRRVMTEFADQPHDEDFLVYVYTLSTALLFVKKFEEAGALLARFQVDAKDSTSSVGQKLSELSKLTRVFNKPNEEELQKFIASGPSKIDLGTLRLLFDLFIERDEVLNAMTVHTMLSEMGGDQSYHALLLSNVRVHLERSEFTTALSILRRGLERSSTLERGEINAIIQRIELHLKSPTSLDNLLSMCVSNTENTYSIPVELDSAFAERVFPVMLRVCENSIRQKNYEVPIRLAGAVMSAARCHEKFFGRDFFPVNFTDPILGTDSPLIRGDTEQALMPFANHNISPRSLAFEIFNESALPDENYVRLMKVFWDAARLCGKKHQAVKYVIDFANARQLKDPECKFRSQMMVMSAAVEAGKNGGDMTHAISAARYFFAEHNTSYFACFVFLMVIRNAKDQRELIALKHFMARANMPSRSLYCMYTGEENKHRTHKWAMINYLGLHKILPTEPLLLLLMGIRSLCLSIYQKHTPSSRHKYLRVGIALMLKYRKTRKRSPGTPHALLEAECNYNFARAMHGVGFFNVARPFYEAVMWSKLPVENADAQCLKRLSAFNVAITLQRSGSTALANSYLNKFNVL
mmetsp:Transcript_8194/g.21515  ORF Transcript_8194/g.21515 Transcript_8194/m.21515 type:complete len:727 (-) Transcript_8194:164-2344(-)